LIGELNEGLHVTVVIVSHDLTTLFGVCHRVAVLVERHLVVDTVDALMRSNEPWIHELLHGPRARGAITARKQAHGKR